MKLTVVTDAKGEIVGTMRGHCKDHRKESEDCASLVPGPGETFHEIEAPDELADLSAADLHNEFAKSLSRYTKG